MNDSPQPGSPAPTTPTSADRTVDAAIKTYDYLRMAVVGLAVLLLVAIGIEIATGVGLLGSISAYYYTPVRSVFVGALVAIGLALIALKGRDANGEDVLLNVAGMLAPIVAFAPTPLVVRSDFAGGFLQSAGLKPVGEGLACKADQVRCMPGDFGSSVTNNVWALVVVGALGLALAWWMASLEWARNRSDGVVGAADFERRSRRGLLVGLGVIVVFLAVFLAARGTFLALAHYVSAIAMFGALVLVVRINAHEATRVTVMHREMSFAGAYRVIWTLMAAILAAAAAYGAVLFVSDRTAWSKLVFFLEVGLLLPFIAFWVLQTIEFFRKGVPPETA
jgi:hypothetical protein